MDSQNRDKDEQIGPGIRFGADVTNAYAGEVGYDTGPVEYVTEIGSDDDDEMEDQGRMQASHPSTLQRQMVCDCVYIFFDYVFACDRDLISMLCLIFVVNM